jgi:hypothetical protein
MSIQSILARLSSCDRVKMFFGLFGNGWKRRTLGLLQDSGGLEQTDGTPEEVQRQTYERGIDDSTAILRDMITDLDYIAPGLYGAWVQECTFGSTSASRRMFLKFTLAIKGKPKPVYSFVVITTSTYPFFKYLSSVLLHKKVEIKVGHTTHGNKTYTHATVIGIPK